MVFPEGAEVVWYEHESRFRESTSVAVVDIPVEAVEEFIRGSGFGEFGPGVPVYWRYWEVTGLAGPLAVEVGNEHSVEGYRDPRRYVVIHDGGADTRRLFVHADC